MDSAEWLNASPAGPDNGGAMRETRRRFLCSAGAAVSGAAFSMRGLAFEAQSHKQKMPTPPLPADSTQQSIPDRPVDATSPRAILLQHEKDFRESLASLSARVNELQAEV